MTKENEALIKDNKIMTHGKRTKDSEALQKDKIYWGVVKGQKITKRYYRIKHNEALFKDKR